MTRKTKRPTPKTLTEHVRSFGQSLGEALTFGIGLVTGLLVLWQTAAHSSGVADRALVVSSAVLVLLGAGVAWRWRLYGIAAGIALSLFSWWLLASIAGAPFD